MSSKYRTLVALSHTVPVPALFALDDAQLAALWVDHGAVRAQAQEVLAGIRLTAGAFLDRDLDRLEAIPSPRWADDADERLAACMQAAGLSPATPLAVRSSGGIEDGAAHSFAGIFESVLQVEGMAALKDAISRVWRSAFSRRAAVERLRCGLLDAPVEMTVIVQRMVDARWAGVAFSHDPIDGRPEMLVEAVQGIGDALVSGAAVSQSVRWGTGGLSGDAPLRDAQEMLVELAAIVRTVEAQLGTAVDVEWASDGERVWVLQGRPITSLGTATDDAPEAAWTDLYLAADEDIAAFRPLPGFANYFRTKRRPLAVLAHAHGVAPGTALLVRGNADGFGAASRMEALCSRFGEDSVVLDFSDGLRQQVLPTRELASRLREVLGAKASTFVIRDYVRGDWGLITQPTADGGVLCECSADGLLAINRGSAQTHTFFLGRGGQVVGAQSAAAAPFGARQREQLYEATHAAVARFGPVQLEWVAGAGGLRLIDFSPIRSLHAAQLEDSHEEEGRRTISPGFAQGAALVVPADGHLEDISIAATVSISHMPSAESLGPAMVRLAERARAGGGEMIVVAPRPYAALAALIPYVRGFVFEQASMLCHLAILLREGQVPAIASRALYARGLDGGSLTIEARTAPRAARTSPEAA
ncbi:PEP/pyruvate-binding domain-containing protein [Variovorax atrisoli]|uniref:PEP/pyruvate-binding domain-containing protein n=1 Tax=Variovorax atrisoli TaxID=3394203 RepID=UPI00404007C2